MKFNVEVEIDWLEDGNLDAVVQEQIIQGIVTRLSKGFVEKITQESMNRVNAKLEELVTKRFEEFMDEGITVTDRWGDIAEDNVKVKTLIKERLDRALGEKVNRDGRTSDYGDTTRLQFMIDSRINTAVEKLTKDTVAQVDAKIAGSVNSAIKERLSASLLAKIDVDSIIDQTVKKLTK